MAEQQCVGHIQLVFFDEIQGETILLGGASFFSPQESEAAWQNVPEFEGMSAFMADRLDENEDIIDDKLVSEDTCERLLGKPINLLIAEGRARLAAELQQKALLSPI